MTYVLEHRTISVGAVERANNRHEIRDGRVEVGDEETAQDLARETGMTLIQRPDDVKDSEDDEADETASTAREMGREELDAMDYHTLQAIAADERLEDVNGNSPKDEILDALMRLPPGDARVIVSRYT